MLLRDKILERAAFDMLLEAKVLIKRWRQHYNASRPHSALGYRPPQPHKTRLSEGKTINHKLASFMGACHDLFDEDPRPIPRGAEWATRSPLAAAVRLGESQKTHKPPFLTRGKIRYNRGSRRGRHEAALSCGHIPQSHFAASFSERAATDLVHVTQSLGGVVHGTARLGKAA